MIMASLGQVSSRDKCYLGGGTGERKQVTAGGGVDEGNRCGGQGITLQGHSVKRGMLPECPDVGHLRCDRCVDIAGVGERCYLGPQVCSMTLWVVYGFRFTHYPLSPPQGPAEPDPFPRLWPAAGARS